MPTSMITDASPIRFAAPLPAEVDVVVIGAGIAGTASAYYLAKAGERVLLAEKGRIAGEQSSRNWGWVRQQGRDWAELPIMMEANRLWRGLAAETGEADLAFTEAGCLRLTDDPKVAAGYEEWRELSQQHQLETRILSADEIARDYPDIAPPAGKRWAAAMLTPSDGRAEPFVAIPALARAAERAGAHVREACAVRTLDRQGGRIVGVVTEAGRVACSQVVLASGAWSTHFAHNEGLTLPQLAVRSTVGRTEAAPDAYGPNISTPGLTLRRRADGGYSVTSGDIAEHFIGVNSLRWFFKYQPLLKKSARDVRLIPAAPKGYPGSWGMPRRWRSDETSPFERARVLNPEPNKEVIRRIEQRLPQRFPALAGTKLAEAWAGMIDVTPDAVPYIAEHHNQPGLYIATGLSGHGFGIGPAVGRIMADLVLGRPSGHDLSRFRTGRFADGSAIEPGPY